MKIDFITCGLNKMIPNPVCELDYKKDYELLIATVLSAQSTDKRVNQVTKILFKEYDIFSLAKVNPKKIEVIIRPVGTYTRKAKYIIEIAKKLVVDYEGVIPNNREFLESLPGVGRKTANVVLSNLFNVPAIAVDTHVNRVAIKLGLASKTADVRQIEKKLMRSFKKNEWNKINDQMLLFGRYICKSIKPNCSECVFNANCKYKKID